MHLWKVSKLIFLYSEHYGLSFSPYSLNVLTPNLCYKPVWMDSLLFFLVEMHIKTWILSRICTSFPSKTWSQQEVDLDWILTIRNQEINVNKGGIVLSKTEKLLNRASLQTRKETHLKANTLGKDCRISKKRLLARCLVCHFVQLVTRNTTRQKVELQIYHLTDWQWGIIGRCPTILIHGLWHSVST